MENKMFLVSFANSDTYVATQQELDNAQVSVEKYLKDNFAGVDVDYDLLKYADVKEIHPAEMKDYESYRHLDAAAISEVESAVATAVKVMESDKELNSDAGRW